jgi:rhodanese-related sulfurtransferase
MALHSLKDVIAAADAVTVIDVREAAEVAASGQAKGALHIPLSLLAMRADPKGGAYDARIDPKKPVAIYCAAGGRAGMAAATLKSMGYEAINIGGFADWVAAGGPVSK